ncbi:GMC oxidoreductase [Hydnomerulius pinastri MD-312]|nr:GMC oxidoreductase [Hydnomerulius pinastri MD-312]
MVEVGIFGRSSLIDHDGKLLPLSHGDEDSFNPANLSDFAVMASAISDPTSKGNDKSEGFLGLGASLLKATSRGHLRLRSSNPNDTPLCEMRYISTPEDTFALRAALQDGDLDAFIEQKVDTMYHYSSSCRMAPLDDALPGVVDDELRVHGIGNLRIADASIFPAVPATHPQALVYTVAEKCADMILHHSCVAN